VTVTRLFRAVTGGKCAFVFKSKEVGWHWRNIPSKSGAAQSTTRIFVGLGRVTDIGKGVVAPVLWLCFAVLELLLSVTLVPGWEILTSLGSEG
jgi:hypothetical protein